MRVCGVGWAVVLGQLCFEIISFLLPENGNLPPTLFQTTSTLTLPELRFPFGGTRGNLSQGQKEGLLGGGPLHFVLRKKDQGRWSGRP